MLMKARELAMRNLGSVILVVMLSGSLGVNLALGIRLRTVLTPHVAGVKVGAHLAKLPVVALDGVKRELRLDDGKWSVIYIMSPSCIWCARNLDNVRAMASETGSKYRFIGLSTTSSKLQEYLASTPLPFPVLTVDPSRLPEGLDISATPQTLVVGPDGHVRKVWAGALSGARQSDAEAFFHLTLPGLPKDSGS